MRSHTPGRNIVTATSISLKRLSRQSDKPNTQPIRRYLVHYALAAAQVMIAPSTPVTYTPPPGIRQPLPGDDICL